MIDIVLKNKPNGSFDEELHLPTNLNEISPDWFKAISDKVIPADNYSLVALISFERLSLILNSSKRKETVTAGVLPLFIKSGVTDSRFINELETGTPIVTVSSVLSRAIHVNIKNNILSPTKLVAMLSNNVDIAKKVLTEYTTPVVLIEFKLIPNCDIYGIYPKHPDTTRDVVFDLYVLVDGEYVKQ